MHPLSLSGLTSILEIKLNDQTPKGSGLRRLPADLLNGLTSLQTICFTRSGLRTLPSGFFADQSNLIQLFLSHNDLGCLPPAIFSSLSSVTTLEIDGNPKLECGGQIVSWGNLNSPSSGGGCASSTVDCAAADWVLGDPSSFGSFISSSCDDICGNHGKECLQTGLNALDGANNGGLLLAAFAEAGLTCTQILIPCESQSCGGQANCCPSWASPYSHGSSGDCFGGRPIASCSVVSVLQAAN